VQCIPAAAESPPAVMAAGGDSFSVLAVTAAD